MKKQIIDERSIRAFSAHLCEEEKSPVTREKYIRDVRKFAAFLQGAPVTKARTIAYKQYLLESGYETTSVNSMLSALNTFLMYLGLAECKVRSIRTQRKAYLSPQKELTREEYMRLLQAAGNDLKMNLLLQTICATGIRVSELRFFTVEGLQRGEVTVSGKNKTRTVLVPGALRKKLLKYAKAQNITGGPVFVTHSGKPLDRSNIWRKMKQLCAAAQVEPEKVFPHNLRKLFARCFYAIKKDIAKLADVLGHTSIDTTRIYIMTTGREHRRQLEQMRLIL